MGREVGEMEEIEEREANSIHWRIGMLYSTIHRLSPKIKMHKTHNLCCMHKC